METKRAKNIVGVIAERIGDFFNPPMIGGLAAVVGGVIPFLHRWLFSKDGWMKPYVNVFFISGRGKAKWMQTHQECIESGRSLYRTADVRPRCAFTVEKVCPIPIRRGDMH